jgi:copper chaperone
MKTYQFKTNINCSGCISNITPHLNANKAIKSWKVDTANPNKVLTIETDTLSSDTIEAIVKGAGYKAEPLSQG